MGDNDDNDDDDDDDDDDNDHISGFLLHVSTSRWFLGYTFITIGKAQ